MHKKCSRKIGESTTNELLMRLCLHTLCSTEGTLTHACKPALEQRGVKVQGGWGKPKH